MNVLEMLSQRRSTEPQFFALRDRDEDACSCDALWRKVARVSRALGRLGVSDGAHVLVLPENMIESLVAILAVMCAGGVAVPVNGRFGQNNLWRVVDDLKPACCIAEDLPSTDMQALIGKSGTRILLTRGLMAASEGESDVLAPRSRTGEDAALLLHTSGSTGQPKRIYRTHGQLSAFVELNHVILSQYAAVDEGRLLPDPLVTAPQISHLAGLGYCLEGLYGGATVYLLRQFEAARVLTLIETARLRLLILVPSLYELLLHEHSRAPGRDFSSLRYCVYAGEGCPPELARRIEKQFGVRPIAAYGLTECMVGIAHSRRDLEAGSYRTGSCGTYFAGEVRLVDDAGQENPDQGELWVRNPTVPKPELLGVADARVTRDGWFRTGDMLSRDVDGYFYHRGRVDEMFPCNGNNVYPLQVEQILCAHPAVAGACVVPVRNRKGHVVPAALVRRTGAVEVSDLVQLAREHAPRFAVPAFIEFAEELPVAPSGKLDRVGIKARLQKSYEARV